MMLIRFKRTILCSIALLLTATPVLGVGWLSPTGTAFAESVQQTIIIDNDNEGPPNIADGLTTTTKGYSSSGMLGGGTKSPLAYAKGSQNANNNAAYAMYTPSLSGQAFDMGTYRVSAWIVQRTSFDARVQTEVYRNGESVKDSFPNLAPAGGWVSLGEFDFTGSGTEYVKLSRDPAGPTGYFNADSVKFERLPSRIVTLSDLKIGAISIYRPTVTDYTYNVANEVSSITLEPLSSDPKAVVKVQGTAVPRGASSPIALAVGDNEIVIEVIAENESYNQRYMLKVKRAAGSSTDADLKELRINQTALPDFHSSVTSYTYSVAHAHSSVTITAVSSDAHATVKVNGIEVKADDPGLPVTLLEGTNEIRLQVIAENPAYSKIYTLTIVRQRADATLKTLRINGQELTRGYQVVQGQNQSPGFEPSVTEYAYSLPVNESDMVVTAQANDPNARIKLNGEPLSQASVPISMDIGVRQVLVEVEAEDRAYKKQYHITVGRGDHALGKPVKASQEYYLTPGKQAVDGSGTTVWRNVLADGTPYVWLEMDLLRKTTFNRVVGAFYNYLDMKNFKIQYSEDAEHWQDAYVKSTTPDAIESVVFPEVTARYVRFYADKAKDLVYTGLYSFEVYGNSAPTDVPGDEYERLSGISLSSGTIAFDPYVTDYTVVTDGNITVAPDIGAEGQTFRMDGVRQDSMYVSKESLYGQPRTVSIEVTSKDGRILMTYRLHMELVPSVPGSGYTLAFEDEFDGISVKEDQWYYRTGGNAYSDNKKENVSVSDGMLRIALKEESADGGKPYSGGGLITKPLLGYGYYETRFKQWNKAGFHSSFWIAGMNPRVTVLDGDRPYSPATDYQVNEIDGFEIETSAPAEILTAGHYWWPGDTHLVYVPYTTHTGVDSSDGYHTYGFEWTPTKIKYYIDGKMFREEYYPGPHGAGTQGRGQHLWLTSLVYKLPVAEAALPAEVSYDYFKYYTKDYGLDAPDDAVLIDNEDAGYSETGTWTSASEAFGYDDNDTRSTRSAGDQAEWKTELARTGAYEVKVWNPSFHNNTTSAKYTVRHSEGATEVLIDQKLGGQQWLSLGTYRFMSGSTASVAVTASDSAFLRTDAVMFVPVSLVPDTPVHLTASKQTPQQAELTWEQSEGAEGYKLYRADSEQGPYREVYRGSAPAFTDTEVKPPRHYYYKVAGFNKEGESVPSGPIRLNTVPNSEHGKNKPKP